MSHSIDNKNKSQEINQRHFKGIWIEANIWLHNDLSAIEKVLLAEIDSLSGTVPCFASNEYLSKFLGVSERNVRKHIAKLKSLDLICEIKFDGRRRYLCLVKDKCKYKKFLNEGGRKRPAREVENDRSGSLTNPQRPITKIYNKEEEGAPSSSVFLKKKNLATECEKKDSDSSRVRLVKTEKGHSFVGLKHLIPKLKRTYEHLGINIEAELRSCLLKASETLTEGPCINYILSWFQNAMKYSFNS